MENLAFIAYSDARWLYYQLSLPSVIQFSLQGWDNAVFELESERVEPFTFKFTDSKYIPQTFFKKRMLSEVVRIGSRIIFHLSKLWKTKFFILWGCRGNLKLKKKASPRIFSWKILFIVAGVLVHLKSCMLWISNAYPNNGVSDIQDFEKFPSQHALRPFAGSDLAWLQVDVVIPSPVLGSGFG